MSGLTIHPCSSIAEIRGLYLFCLVLMAWSMNLSCVNVYSIICMARFKACRNGPSCSCVAPCICIMSWHSLARHVHGRSHEGMMWSCGRSKLQLAFVSV